MTSASPIGVLDSGVGGIGVLAEGLRRLPNERFLFLGDLAHAPYGSRDEEEIRELALNAARRLEREHIKALVVACNTATSAAIELLRREFAFPVIGIEPALKPALIHGSPRQKVAVMATPATLRQEKFIRLAQKLAEPGQVICLPCPGLSRMVETDGPGSPTILAYLHELLDPVERPNLGAVVLGCTHYSFLKNDIASVCGPEVSLYDGNAGTIRQLENRLREEGLLCTEPIPGPRCTILPSLGTAEESALFERFLAMAMEDTAR